MPEPKDASPADEPLRRRRTRFTPEARRDQLLAIGVEALERLPLESITMERVAAGADVTPGLVFYYFPSRAELHEAILETATATFLDYIRPDLDLPPLEQVRDALARAVQFARSQPGTYTAIGGGATDASPVIRGANQWLRNTVTRHVTAVLAQLGVDAEPLVTCAIRNWVAMTEQVLVGVAGKHPALAPLSQAQVVSMLAASLPKLVEAVGVDVPEAS